MLAGMIKYCERSPNTKSLCVWLGSVLLQLQSHGFRVLPQIPSGIHWGVSNPFNRSVLNQITLYTWLRKETKDTLWC